MKNALITLSLGALICLPIVSTAEHFEKAHVSAYGTATVDVVPDIMRWQLGVRTTAKTVQETASNHDKNVAAVLAFLKREEIKEEKIQTSRLQLAEDLEFRNGTRTRKGYYASTSISFESKTLDAYRSLWMGLSKLTAVSVNGVSFDTSQRIRHQNNARVQAVQAARDKASQMAAVLGNELANPLMIEEEPSLQDDRRSMLANTRMSRVAADSSAGGPSLSVGTIPIRARVKVVFSLRNGE